jgi:putative transposase
MRSIATQEIMFYPFLREFLCKSYIPSQAPSNSMPKRSPTPIVTGPNIACSVKAQHWLTAHGFYSRTLVDAGFDGSIRVRRYLCRSCKRTVSLLPEFALPYLRFSISVLSLFLTARLLQSATLAAAATKAAQTAMPYQRGQFWVRRFHAADRRPLCGAGGFDRPTGSSQLRPARSGHVAIHRLDRRPPLPVRRSAIPPVGLAGVSRSGRALCRAPLGDASHLTVPTQLLHGAVDTRGLMLLAQEIFFMDAKAEKIALFRYGLIAPLVLESLPRGELTRRAQEIAARHYEIPHSERTSISVDTLLEWALRYRNGGFEALAPQARQDRGKSRTLTPQLADLIERLKRENPHRTGTTLLRELALSSGKNAPGVSASTLYRFLKQRGLSEKQLLAPPAHKKFEAEHSNQIWQSDMLFGPYVPRPGGGKIQAYLHATLDDASRLIPHAQFYLSQGLDACLDCLRQAIAARGLPVRLYVDNAKIYRGQQLARIAASIGILVVHTPPYQPEGRGKIERYFRSVREQFLANLDRKQTLSLEDLNERLWAWIDNAYHRTEHSSLGTTPLVRWQRDIEHVRQLPPATDLRRLFFHRLNRLVRRDCTFLLQNCYYEAPPQLVGETIQVRFDPLDAVSVEIYFQGKPQGMARLVDPVINGQLPSDKPSKAAAPEPTGINFVDLLIKKKDEEEPPW